MPVSMLFWKNYGRNKEYKALIGACRFNLWDDLARLVLADWLEERGFESILRKWITVVKPKVHQSWLNGSIDESLEEDLDCKELISIEVFKLTVRDLELNEYKWFEKQLFKYELHCYGLWKVDKFRDNFKPYTLGSMLVAFMNLLNEDDYTKGRRLFLLNILLLQTIRRDRKIKGRVKENLNQISQYLSLVAERFITDESFRWKYLSELEIG